MKPKKRIIVFLPMLILMLCFCDRTEANHRWNLLEKYESDPSIFTECEIGSKVVYYYYRKIGQAIVEKDYLIYHFDKENQQLINVKMHWREDLPLSLPKLNITKEQAESVVQGTVDCSALYIISPESDIFSPIKPVPQNLCWAVYSISQTKGSLLTVIDAVEGKVLGYGIAPPHTAFSLSGPQFQNPCWGSWDAWYQNAQWWFDVMGYDTEAVRWPTQATVQSHVQSDTTAMFYELAHGDSWGFASGCEAGWYEWTWAAEIEDWIVDYSKMPFTFLGSCDGMCFTGDGTLSYEFRKGSMKNTATVGYCGMGAAPCSQVCWPLSVDWQDALFGYMNDGHTVKESFDLANADYPACFENMCMRFAGDDNLQVVNPIVTRNCFPDCHPDYDEWILMGRPECWCYSPYDGTSYQCDGDADSKDSGGILKYRVFTGDLNLIVANWQKKLGDPTLNPCADIDHKDSGGLLKYRVYTGDLNIVVANWKKKDAQLPDNCASCERGQQAKASELTLEDLVKRLEDIWLDPEVQQVINEDAWLKFMESLMDEMQHSLMKSSSYE
jgi:hypothetical protein